MNINLTDVELTLSMRLLRATLVEQITLPHSSLLPSMAEVHCVDLILEKLEAALDHANTEFE